MISCEDIGWFSARAFLHPEEWIGKITNIAGDNVTYPEALKYYLDVCKESPPHSRLLAKFVIPLFADARKMFEWYREARFNADIPGLRKLHPGMLSLKDYFTGLKKL